MPTFHGTLRLAAEPDTVHSATVILVDDRFVLRAAGGEIGDWALRDLNFDYAGEEIRVQIDGDDALLSMPERGAFAAAVGLSEAGHSDPATPEPPATPDPEAASEAAAATNYRTVAPEQTAMPEATTAPPPANESPEVPPGVPDIPREEEGAAEFEIAPISDAPAATTEAASPVAATDPAPAPDFSVGAGGGPWEEQGTVEAPPEPGFAVASSPPVVPPAEVPLLPEDEPAPQPDPGPTVSAADPDPRVPPTAASEPGVGLTTPDAEPFPAHPDRAEPTSEADLVPTDSPQGAAVPASPSGARTPWETEEPSTPDQPDAPEGPADADEPPAADEAPHDGAVSDDLPVDASAAAAAVWQVRTQPEPADFDTAEPISPGDPVAQDADDVVASRLASQRQATFRTSEDPAPVDTSVADTDQQQDRPASVAAGEMPDTGLPEPTGGEESAAAVAALSSDDTDDAAQRFERLRAQSTAGYLDDETLRNWVAWGLLVGGVLIGIGAFLAWGDARMFDTDFPVARALAAVAALAAIAGFVLGFFMHRRIEGAYVAGVGAVLGLMTLVVYARAAGIGTGFFLALLGVLVVAGLSVLAITPAGGSREKRVGR